MSVDGARGVPPDSAVVEEKASAWGRPSIEEIELVAEDNKPFELLVAKMLRFEGGRGGFTSVGRPPSCSTISRIIDYCTRLMQPVYVKRLVQNRKLIGKCQPKRMPQSVLGELVGWLLQRSTSIYDYVGC